MKKQCKKIQHEFFNAYYNQIEKDKKLMFIDHLKSCAKCADEFSKYKSTLEIMKQYKRPEPGNEFWNMYWENLKPQLIAKRVSPLSWIKETLTSISIHVRPVYAYAGTAILFLIIGIFVAKFFLQQPGIKEQTSLNVRQIAGRQNAEHLIQRAQVIFLGIMNNDTNKPIWAEEIRASNQLLKDTDSIKKELDPSTQLRLLTLISELEVLLMQIANIDSEYDPGTVELIRSSIKHQGILFKININEIMKTNDKNQPDNKSSDTKKI